MSEINPLSREEAIERVNALKEKTGMTISMLAKITGVKSNTLSTWSSGIRQPSRAKLEEIERKVDDFLSTTKKYVRNDDEFDFF